ncbi:ATPase [Aureimonas endophytica]|uniref:histidine kinase n=1 Tax=Aureimonas endophytica TaxID=2027858 RepID=A0A916ZGP8_9HYPH|nr:HAMP domain-containing sensor histidine kinase [Aureimonas endophytica]GGD96756.1 ATPase [Aureimonas endophytica]
MTVSEQRSEAAGDGPRRTERARSPGPAIRKPLSVSLLWVTLLSVMVAEIFIFVPSVAHFRLEWLRQKLETAAAAGLTAEQPKEPEEAVLGPRQQAALLDALQADLVAIASGGTTRLLARKETIPTLDRQVDIAKTRWPTLIGGAIDTLLFGGNRTLRVLGPVGDDEETGRIVAEVVFPERKLRAAMLVYARNVFLLSLLIALFAGCLVYAAISSLLIRPIRAMTRSMLRFGEAPTDASRIIAPSGRADEIGAAEAELASMQATLATTLREQRHLADLGLAVSKINHDLRNILASAQMVSDRLADVQEPRVQRALPLLLRSLDRALSYTQSVMSYGKAVESEPVRRRIRLHRLVADVFEVAPVAPDSEIELVNAVPEDFEIDVDADQFFRALNNLCRNAVQALEAESGVIFVRRITIGAERAADGTPVIRVEDTGPGLPPRARAHLFRAFRGSGRAGGTGLGLAIAAEIVEAHGGRIELVDAPSAGARFEIRLPRPEARLGPPDAA